MRSEPLAMVVTSTLLACGRPPLPELATDVALGGQASLGEARATKAPSQGNPRSDLIPRELLFGNPERTSVTISPDGKHLAWLAPSAGVLNVWVAPLGKLAEARPITSETSRPIRSYLWPYSGRHLLYLQDTEGNENFHVFAVDLQAGTTTNLTPKPEARASIAWTNPKKPNTLVVAINERDPEVFDLVTIDLVSGKREVLIQNDDHFMGFEIDHAMKVRFAVKKQPDGATQILRADGSKNWKPYETIPFEDAETTSIIGFAPGNNAVYMAESRNRDTAALVTLDLATKRQRVLAQDPRADFAGVLVHPTRHHVQAVAFDYDRVRWAVLDPTVQGDLESLGKVDGGEPLVVSRTLDDKTWIVVTNSPRRPGQYYLWDRSKQQATFLFAARPGLADQPLVEMHPVEVRSRDGLTLMSYLSLPPGSDPDGDGKPERPLPMVLLVHGGPWARDRWGYNPYHQHLANRGYAVLSVNFRGSTGFGKKFLNAANLEWSKAMHNDLLDAVAWAVQRGTAAKDKVCIMGGSYGGYATLVGLAMTPDVFSCGVDIVGPSNLLTLLGSIPPYWAPVVALFHTRMGNPETPEGRELLVQASPLTHARQIRRPLLIAQGANDPRVKQAESEQIVAAMKEHGLPVTYALFPDEGHGFARPENNIAFTAMTEAFLSAHLGGLYLPITQQELSASTVQIREGQDGVPGLSSLDSP